MFDYWRFLGPGTPAEGISLAVASFLQPVKELNVCFKMASPRRYHLAFGQGEKFLWRKHRESWSGELSTQLEVQRVQLPVSDQAMVHLND